MVKIVLKSGSAEITEKKSRFIATVQSTASVEEAEAFISLSRKKYWDARHNCYAFIIGGMAEFSRCSDDGEPSGTAGRPMLNALKSAGVHDVCAVVTRYFGGVLLGTGGLARAYSRAVREALDNCAIAEEIYGTRLRIKTTYDNIGKVRYIVLKRSLPVTDTTYTESVQIETIVSSKDLNSLMAEITEKTNAKAEFVKKEDIKYALANGSVIIL